jgi:hypothetical protein
MPRKSACYIQSDRKLIARTHREDKDLVLRDAQEGAEQVSIRSEDGICVLLASEPRDRP